MRKAIPLYKRKIQRDLKRVFSAGLLLEISQGIRQPRFTAVFHFH